MKMPAHCHVTDLAAELAMRRTIDATGLDTWDLALDVVLRIGNQKAPGPYPKSTWRSPFRVDGRRWFVLNEAGGYEEKPRDYACILVRRALDRHFRFKHGEPTHIGVTRRLVAAVVREIAALPCVRVDQEGGSNGH